MGNAIDCPTCRGSGFLVADEPPHEGGHNRYDPHCRERRPNDALKSDEFCTLCPGSSVVTPPAQDERLCNCGHLRSDHFLNSPTSCRFTACRCGSFVSVAAAPSVSTDIDKRGEQYIEKRLAEAASEVEGIERRLTGARFRRDALIAKLLAAGASERHIAEIAKVSGPRVHQIKEASRG